MSQPDSTVKVPVVGGVQRRWILIGAAAVAVFVGYAYWKRAKTPGTVYDPSTGTVDLGTGGYQNPAPTSPRSGPIDEPGVISNDAEWSMDAIDKLEGADFNRAYASITIGKYLAGQPLDENELDLVRAAWALAGHPPSNIAAVSQPSTGTPAPTPTPVNPGGGPSIPETLVAPGGTDIDTWAQGVTAQYGYPVSLAGLRSLNPGLDSHIKWVARSNPQDQADWGNSPQFLSDTTVRVR